jgi:hypothetical protein
MAQVEPSLWEVIYNKKYRRGSIVTTSLACLFFCCGAPLIPIVSNTIFSKTDVNKGVASMVISLTSLFGAMAGPFIVKNVPSRTIFLAGQGCLSVLLLLTTILFAVDEDNAAFYCVVAIIFVFGMSMGTFTFAYCGSVCYSNQISLYNTTSFVMMMVVQTLLEVNA